MFSKVEEKIKSLSMPDAVSGAEQPHLSPPAKFILFPPAGDRNQALSTKHRFLIPEMTAAFQKSVAGTHLGALCCALHVIHLRDTRKVMGVWSSSPTSLSTG